MSGFKRSEAGQDPGPARRRADRRLQAPARHRSARPSTSSRTRRSSTWRAPARRTTFRTRSRNSCRRSPAASPTSSASARCSTPRGGGSGDSATVVSVAGNSPRYNALQIDGAANNDLFGLASSSGAPGGTAETQPISLDAIQEIQLVVSPVRRSPGRLHRRRHQRDHEERHQQHSRHRVLLHAQPGLGGQGLHRHQDLDAQGQAGRLQPRRPDHEEPRVLLRHCGLRPQGTSDRLLREPGWPDDGQRGAGHAVRRTRSRAAMATRCPAIRSGSSTS